MKSRKITLLRITALLLIVGALATSVVYAGNHGNPVSESAVTLFGDPGTLISDATSTLTRSDRGVNVRLSTTGLEPGNTYTLWIVPFNEPSNCTAADCAFPDDRFLVSSAELSAHFMDGKVAGGNGTANFAGSLKINDLKNVLVGHTEDATFDNPQGAQFLLIIRNHGPKQPGEVANQISTFHGGCNAASSPLLGTGTYPCTLDQQSLHVPAP